MPLLPIHLFLLTLVLILTDRCSYLFWASTAKSNVFNFTSQWRNQFVIFLPQSHNRLYTVKQIDHLGHSIDPSSCIILISPSFSNVHVFRLVMSVGQRKNSESLRGIKPQIFGFCALMLCPWATDSTVSVEKVWVKRYAAMLESITGHWVKFGTQTNPLGFHCSETLISQQFLFWIRKELLGEKFTPIIRKPSWCVNSWLKPRRHWILPQEW